MDYGSKSSRTKVDALTDQSPVVVGGIGGSGTRVVAQLLADLGFFIGSDLNDSLDDLGFTALFKRIALWPLEANAVPLTQALSIYLTSRGIAVPPGINQEEHRKRTERLIGDIALREKWLEHGEITDRLTELCQIDDLPEKWGWKEPNAWVVLPFLLDAIPRVKYIHVLRDGRDMALSNNKNQLQLWGEALLGRPIDSESVEDALDYWCYIHERLVPLSRKHPHNVLLVKLESLIEAPTPTMGAILNFLGENEGHNVDLLIQKIKRPSSVGRHLNIAFSVTNKQALILNQLGYGT